MKSINQPLFIHQSSQSKGRFTIFTCDGVVNVYVPNLLVRNIAIMVTEFSVSPTGVIMTVSQKVQSWQMRSQIKESLSCMRNNLACSPPPGACICPSSPSGTLTLGLCGRDGDPVDYSWQSHSRSCKSRRGS